MLAVAAKPPATTNGVKRNKRKMQETATSSAASERFLRPSAHMPKEVACRILIKTLFRSFWACQACSALRARDDRTAIQKEAA